MKFEKGIPVNEQLDELKKFETFCTTIKPTFDRKVDGVAGFPVMGKIEITYTVYGTGREILSMAMKCNPMATDKERMGLLEKELSKGFVKSLQMTSQD